MPEAKDFFAREVRPSERLADDLASGDAMIRWAAAVAMGSADDPALVSSLTRALHDDDELVRSAAQSSLERLKCSLGDQLQEALDSDLSKRAIDAGARGLRRLRSETDAPPYVAWKVRELPRPCDCDPYLLEAAIMDIVGTEGPILGKRLVCLYGQACSRDNPRSFPRTRLINAVRHLVIEGVLICVDGLASSAVEEWTLRTCNQPDVRVRQRGHRELGEIPVSEVRAVWRATQRGSLRTARAGSDQILQFVLGFYGVHRSDLHVVGRLFEHEWMPLLREV